MANYFAYSAVARRWHRQLRLGDVDLGPNIASRSHAHRADGDGVYYQRGIMAIRRARQDGDANNFLNSRKHPHGVQHRFYNATNHSSAD